MKSDDMGPRPNKQMLEEASAWFVDFRVGDVDDAARERFRHWLQRSPEHIQAYLDIARTYVQLPSPSGSGELDIVALINHARSAADDNVVGLGPRSAVLPPSSRGEGSRSRGHALRVFAVAASIMVVTVSVWLYAQRNTFATDVGEQRSLTLADGSTVQLNSRSAIRVRYGETREVDLLEGQALFEVAKDVERPFIVRSAQAQIRAVGTRFDVYRKAGGTVVTVVEGRVTVSSDSPPSRSVKGSASDGADEPGSRSLGTAEGGAASGDMAELAGAVLLVAGEQLTITPTVIEEPTAVNVATATAWTQRRLVFENAPLSEVAAEFNRYSARPMIVEAVALDGFHISGTYSSSNHESLLRFLRAQPGVSVTATEREIRVAAHKPPGG